MTMEQLDVQKLFGFNWKGLQAEELMTLADSDKVMQVLDKMYQEVTRRYIETRYAYPPSADVNDIKEKLDYAKQIEIDRLFYTLKHLARLANTEYARRGLDKAD
jgi:hypothetical protein